MSEYDQIGSLPPYYDDFDEDKNYLRVLFNPGRAVQGRELTQAQTILQNQVSRFGSHIFKDGSSIIDGKISVDQEKPYIELEALDSGAVAVTVDANWIGAELTGITSGATATVDTYDATDRILYINYLGGEFVPSEEVSVSGGLVTNNAVIITDGVGQGTLAHINKGIIYVDGHFLVVTEQNIIVEKRNVSTTHKIGLIITNSAITSSEDSTLNDPAAGAYNFNAPGADRYNVLATLTSYESAETPDDDFLSIIEITDGRTTKEQKLVEYSAILDTLAQRTFDESGNYSIDAFNMKAIDHDTDDTKCTIIADPGKAYVLGYEVETVSPTHIDIDRARTSKTENQALVTTEYGHYVDVDYTTATDIDGTLDTDTKEEIELMDTTDGTGNILGEGRIISIVASATNELRLYLSGMDKYESIFSNVRSIRSKNTPANWMNLKLYTEDGDVPRLLGKNNKSLIFETSHEYLKGLVANETSYNVTRVSPATSNGSGVATIAMGVNELVPLDTLSVVYITKVSDGSLRTTYTPTGQTTTTLTISGLENSTAYNVTHVVFKQQPGWKSKVLTETTVTNPTDADGEYLLSHTDIFEIVSVIEDPAGTPIDVTTTAVLDNGQRDHVYDYGTVSGLTPSTNHEITYQYYEHTGTGEFFAVDSYPTTSALVNPLTSVAYGEFYGYIAPYTATTGIEFNLRDCFDFRRSVLDLGGGTETVYPNDTITTDYDYYLPRIDKIYVDAYGTFSSMTGVPELTPDYPKDPDDGMVIGTITLLPFTAFTDDIDFELKDNRRYTMEDIGEIERRLENVEYYSAMNLLEQNAKELSVTDKQGFDKFKNGILVDNFSGHDVGDVYHADYRCSVDPDTETLRPHFEIDNIDFDGNVGSSTDMTWTTHENIATKSYTTTPLVSQLLASETINVNPYNVFVWEGSIKLTPSSDNWVDTNKLPNVVVNERDSNSNWINSRVASRAFGTSWGWWRRNWTGVSRRTFVKSLSSNWGRSIANTRRGWSRFGSRVVVRPRTTRRFDGDNTVQTSIVPWIRSRALTYSVSRMKPDTTVLAYFDGVDVSASCTSLTTDANGAMSGTFTVPANTFRTGDRVLRFTDDDTGNSSTSAEVTYTASGLRQTKRRTILSMGAPKRVRQTNEISRVTNSLSSLGRSISARITSWIDPIAESFLVDKEGGVFLSDIDIYFKTKSTNIPITLRIVENENGYPSQSIVPYSEVTLNPGSVSTADSSVVWTGGTPTGLYDASGVTHNATKFTFSDPVYLQDGVEYSFMLLSNSNEYEVYVGKIGANRAGSFSRIDKQPYAGVMFKSQNASTWTADQERDIMFEMNRCVFDTGTPSTYILDSIAPSSNKDVSTNMFNIENILLEGTSINWSYKYTGDAYVSFENKENVDLTLAEILDTTPTNQLHVSAVLATTKDNISPVISLDNASAVIVNTKLSDAQITAPSGTLYYQAGTYITRTTNLATPSDDLKVLLDINQPNNTEVAVYFKTGAYEPRYVPVTNGQEQTSFEEETVYFYYDTTASSTVSLETNAIVSRVDATNDRYYLKSITDSSKLVDPGTLGGQTIFAVLIDDITFLEAWDGGAYTVGQHVWDGGLLFECIQNTTTEATSNGLYWTEVPFTNITNALVSDAEQEWRLMIAEATETENEIGFIETTYKPQELIVDEFNSFSIKIELLTNLSTSFPTCKNFRALAVY